MGWGDRNTESLFLKPGNFTQFSHSNGPNAQKALSAPGSHPFLMMQLASDSTKFAGLFILNASPLSLELKFVGKDASKLTFRATGGVMDVFIFYGPSFDQVIRQY